MVLQIVTDWSGGPMGAGVSVMHCAPGGTMTGTLASAAAAAVAGFWDDARGLWPPSVSARVRSEAYHLDDDNGDLLAVFPTGGSLALAGLSATTQSAAGVGARWRWQTAGVRNGRRVIGTTFMVPLSSNHYEADGTILGATVTAMQANGASLIADLNTATTPLVVYSRESAPGAEDGFTSLVTAATVPDRVAWLRTRKQ